MKDILGTAQKLKYFASCFHKDSDVEEEQKDKRKMTWKMEISITKVEAKLKRV